MRLRKISFVSFLNGHSVARSRAAIVANFYPILAFMVAALVRTLPAVAAWPYAVGFDTNALYIPAMLGRPPSLNLIFEYRNRLSDEVQDL